MCMWRDPTGVVRTAERMVRYTSQTMQGVLQAGIKCSPNTNIGQLPMAR